MTIKERLLAYCEYRHTKIGSFCRYAGISQGYFNSARGDIGQDIQTRIRNTYQDLNVEWLRTGEGEMLNTNSSVPVQPTVMTPYPAEQVQSVGTINGNGNAIINGDHNNVMHSDSPSEPIEIEETVVIGAEVVRRPDYDIVENVRKGTIDGRVKPTQYIVPEHDIKAYTENDEMSPKIEAGDSVLIRFMNEEPEKARIFSGRMYFVDLPSGGVIRYAYENEDNTLTLRSTNKVAYPDVIVRREDVLSISLVVMILKRPSAQSGESVIMSDLLARHDDLFAKMLGEISKAGDRQDKLIEMLNEKK